MMAETITLIKGKGYREVESQIDWEKIKRFIYKTLVRLNYLCIAWTAFSFSASFTIAYIYFTH